MSDQHWNLWLSMNTAWGADRTASSMSLTRGRDVLDVINAANRALDRRKALKGD